MEITQKEYFPERIPRRGEAIAWGLSLVLGITLLILRLAGRAILPAANFLFIFMLLSALSISLGNWMDRRTRLQLYSDGLEFENGLRHVRLGWNEIQEVQVMPSNWGKKVQVTGEQSHFAFRTLGEVQAQGKVQGRMGFAEGDAILRTILQAASLQKSPDNGGKQVTYRRLS